MKPVSIKTDEEVKPIKHRKVAINGMMWTIKEKKPSFVQRTLPEEEGKVMGSTSYEDLKIYLDKSLNDDLKVMTLRHELVHAFWFAYGFIYVQDINEEIMSEFFAYYGGRIERIVQDYFNTSEEFLHE